MFIEAETSTLHFLPPHKVNIEGQDITGYMQGEYNRTMLTPFHILEREEGAADWL